MLVQVREEKEKLASLSNVAKRGCIKKLNNVWKHVLRKQSNSINNWPLTHLPSELRVNDNRGTHPFLSTHLKKRAQLIKTELVQVQQSLRKHRIKEVSHGASMRQLCSPLFPLGTNFKLTRPI